MMPVKLATLGLFKIKVFRNKGCDVIISANDFPNKMLPPDSNCNVDVVM